MAELQRLFNIKILFIIILIFLFSSAINSETLNLSPVKQLSAWDFNNKTQLTERVTSIPIFLLNYLKEYDGKKNYKNYKLTESQITIVKNSLSLLPASYKKILKDRLLGIFFIENFWGSGFTDYVYDSDKNVYTYMIFNSNTLTKSFSKLVNYKESTCFIKDSPDFNISIDCGDKLPGFLYILLHESTHAIDYVKHITPYVEPAIKKIEEITIDNNSFTKNIWEKYSKPLQKYDYSYRDKVTFYGFGKGPKLKISECKKIYKDLSKTSFVSLYASQNWAEDIAELFTFYYLTEILKQRYKITLFRKQNKIFELQPCSSKIIQDRFKSLKHLLKL